MANTETTGAEGLGRNIYYAKETGHRRLQPECMLTDEEIEIAKIEAERLSWTHKAHPRFEKEKYLLEAQAKKIVEWLEEEMDNAPANLRIATIEKCLQALKEVLGE